MLTNIWSKNLNEKDNLRELDEDGIEINKTTGNKLQQNSPNPDATYPDIQLSGTALDPVG